VGWVGRIKRSAGRKGGISKRRDYEMPIASTYRMDNIMGRVRIVYSLLG
jgi:hypothetical protein